MYVRPLQPIDLAQNDWLPLWARPIDSKHNRGDYFVALIDDQVCGVLTFDHSFYDRPFIRALYVHEDHRRKGVARALIACVESLCPGEKLFTSTNLENLPMQSLLSSIGFALTGVVENLDPSPELIYFKRCA
jgi:GNAT superfamily N-acetyltransferase